MQHCFGFIRPSDMPTFTTNEGISPSLWGRGRRSECALSQLTRGSGGALEHLPHNCYRLVSACCCKPLLSDIIIIIIIVSCPSGILAEPRQTTFWHILIWNESIWWWQEMCYFDDSIKSGISWILDGENAQKVEEFCQKLQGWHVCKYSAAVKFTLIKLHVLAQLFKKCNLSLL